MLASGLARAVFARAELEREMRARCRSRARSALPLVSAATGTRAASRAQRGERVGIELDLVALGVEHLERGLEHAPGRRRCRAARAAASAGAAR